MPALCDKCLELRRCLCVKCAREEWKGAGIVIGLDLRKQHEELLVEAAKAASSLEFFQGINTILLSAVANSRLVDNLPGWVKGWVMEHRAEAHQRAAILTDKDKSEVMSGKMKFSQAIERRKTKLNQKKRKRKGKAK